MMKKIVLFLVSGLFAALTTGAQELAYNEKRVDESAPDSTLRNEDPIKLHEVQRGHQGQASVLLLNHYLMGKEESRWQVPVP